MHNDVMLVSQEELQTKFADSIGSIDNVISKQYLANLANMPVIKPDNDVMLGSSLVEKVRIIEITKLVYDKNEFVLDKVASVLNTLAGNNKQTIFMILDSDAVRTHFYLGIRNDNSENQTSSSEIDSLRKAIRGEFPGSDVNHELTKGEITDLTDKLEGNQQNISSVAAATVVPSERVESIENDQFIQGLEKFVLSMQGEKYTALLLAQGSGLAEVNQYRSALENIYTNISPFQQMQINKSLTTNTGTSNTETTGTNTSTSNSRTAGTNHSQTTGTYQTKTHGSSTTRTKSLSVSASRSASVGIGSTSTSTTMTAGISNSVAKGLSESLSKGTNQSNTSGTNISHSNTETLGSSQSHTAGTNESEGQSRSVNLTVNNRWITSILDKVDQQLKRADSFLSSSMWNTSAYFFSYGDDIDVASIAAHTYSALVQGNESSTETGSVNTWFKDVSQHQDINVSHLIDYLSNFVHPRLQYQNTEVTPATGVSGDELARLFAFPQDSVPGLPVVKTTPFAVEVNSMDHDMHSGHLGNAIRLGNVSRMGQISQQSFVDLDIQSLAGHTFITGSTGAGKSTTVYALLHQLVDAEKKFLVIEPAKGEYKYEFGSLPNVRVYGTNPKFTDLLRINPFYFDRNIHVLEHVDRLIEIFNVAWTMYDAMPAMLKKAILKSYTDAGWSLNTSENVIDKDLYPTVRDLIANLKIVINESGYSAEVKGNYEGALVTRVESLTNGLNGQMFSGNQLSDPELFDQNVIVDLSRIGSAETKSLLMGLLIMRLNEYRMANADGQNKLLSHVTVLEEAHNILRRSGSGTTNLAAKSVEMISNSIAEMRTYGEGFIIADQSPSTVDMSAIRNTNTKIIMRLPDYEDRRTVGLAAALNDDQLEELTKLPKGAAAVYQNDWLEPVLTQVTPYQHHSNGKYVRYDQDINETKRVSLIWVIQALADLEHSTRVDMKQLSVDAQKLDMPVRLTRMVKAWSKTNNRQVPMDELSQVAANTLNIDLSNIEANQVNQVVNNALQQSQLDLNGELTNFMGRMTAMDLAQQANDAAIYNQWKELQQ